MSSSYDTIVVGVGGMGAAALYHLARAGRRVLGIERFALGHAKGSSHGETRIIRKAYFEGEKYVPLVLRSYELWQQLGATAGRPLLFRTGSLEMSEPGFDFVERSQASCEAHRLAYELLDLAEVARRFPAYRLAPGTRAIFQPDGGYVLSEDAIAVQAQLAVGHGAQIHTGEVVLDWQSTSDGGVRVRTDLATYSAGQLVLAAGGWMSRLVPQLAKPLATFKQPVAWFTPSERAHFAPERFPVFIHFSRHGEFFGFPAHGGGPVKIGGPHFGREPIDPDTPERAPSAGQLTAIGEFVRRTLPELAGPPERSAGCIYTMTPDEDFIIDRLPSARQVLVVSPCSGHGYKFAPVVGEIVADLVTRGSTTHAIAPFRIGRFLDGQGAA